MENEEKGMYKTSVVIPYSLKENIKKIASRNREYESVTIRKLLEKAVGVEGYKQDVDFLSRIIRDEMNSVVNTGDISAMMEKQTERIAKMHMKSGKMMAGLFFLNIKILDLLLENDDSDFLRELYMSAMKEGIRYMQIKDYDINMFLENFEATKSVLTKFGGDV
ncbi:hypothetical protein [Bacteroides heparinolyticus]|uniref:hypothetical protein n=1 Tax=Prevotella heparinolytica TaxID=28113 RepID=UPI0035A19B74